MQADDLFIYIFIPFSKQNNGYGQKKKTTDIDSPRNRSSPQGTDRHTTKAKAWWEETPTQGGKGNGMQYKLRKLQKNMKAQDSAQLVGN